MSLNHEQLSSLILTTGTGYEIQKVNDDGSLSIFRGKDVTAFFQRSDHKQHEHRVYDQDGKLIYHRGPDGMLHVSRFAEQRYLEAKRKTVGKTAMQGVGLLRGSLKQALENYRRMTR